MKKFKDAFRGLYVSLKHKSILIQFINGLMAIAVGIILKLNLYEWIVFVMMIGLVITCEIINTCIEKVCDLISIEYNEKIREIKDMSAGAVLFISIAAFLVALIILINKIGG